MKSGAIKEENVDSLSSISDGLMCYYYISSVHIIEVSGSEVQITDSLL